MVAPDQKSARLYLDWLRGVDVSGPKLNARCAWPPRTSSNAHESLAAFRLTAEPSILVTVAMAYRRAGCPGGGRGGGPDPHPLATLARADDRARNPRRSECGRLQNSARAGVSTPTIPLFASAFASRMETEQGTLRARAPSGAAGKSHLPFWVTEELAAEKDGIVPLESNALALRFTTLRPGPDLAMRRPEQQEAQSELLEAPSVIERRLRARVGELVAAQAVEDEAGRSGLRTRRGGTGALSPL